jgi:phospholipid/cholesterol/gamma-HCH transport system substrate-binding protein
MTRSARKPAFLALAIAGFAIAAVLMLGSGADGYRVSVQLQTANGLRDGSVVKIGGAQVGTIDELRVGANDTPVAELKLDKLKGVQISRDASAKVVASNLLGSKYIELEPGRAGGPPASSIAANRVGYPVDLDQVLNVLDADTRTRLQILINEAGVAFTGRQRDFNVVLQQLPRDFSAATRLLAEVAADNHTLGEAVDRSSRFVTRLSAERRQLSRLVRVTATTLGPLAERRADLRAALERAPGTLSTARAFLEDLRAAATPLRPAARAIADSTPSLTATLAELPAFRRAAKPTLDEAVRTAPALTRLGAKVTPTVRRAKPTLQSLASFARASAPLARTLDASANDVLGLVEGWARSIQQGDSLGHIFRGKAIVSAEALRTVLDHDLRQAAAKARRRAKRQKTDTEERTGSRRNSSGGRGPLLDRRLLPDLKLKLPDVPLPRLLDPSSGHAQDNHTRGLGKLLDYLLGP